MTSKPNNHLQPYKVSSLTQECLNNLRKGTSTPKTHLLGFMSQYIQDEEEIKVQEVDQLCCYDRIKKLLIRNDHNKEEKKEHESTLFKAMQIQAKMNQLERDLQQNSSKNTPSSSLTKQNLSRNKPSSKTQHFSFKNNMLDTLKQTGYQKFFQFQKIKKQTSIAKIKSIIGEQLQSKFIKVMTEKDTQKRKLSDDNKCLQRKILEKNVQLETLRSQNTYLKEYIKQLQEKLFGANNQLQNAHLIASYEKWLNEYKESFGEVSIKQLVSYIDSIKNKCLEKFDLIQNKNEIKLNEILVNSEEKCHKLKRELEKLQKRENQLIEVNKNLKLNKAVSELEINELIRAKKQLMSLRQLILSLYSQWYSSRTQNQKSLLKSFNKLKENYSYEEMLNYIVFYGQKLSTNDKLNDYILKILRGIQKIRRIIFPMQSNQKLEPFVVLQKIQAWVQNRVKQNANSKNDARQTKASHMLKLKAKQKEKDELNKFLNDS